MERHIFLKNCLITLILSLSFSGAVGFLSKNAALSHFSQAIGFAPMPLPFRDIGHGKETMYAKHRLVIREDGLSREDSTFLINFLKENHSRPHRTIIPYIAIVNFAEIFPLQLRQSALGHFCDYFPRADSLYLEVTFGNAQQTNTFTSCPKK
jgi:hypothetical protein